MRVYLKPVGLYSTAMVRVADALAAYAPRGVVVEPRLNKPDLQVVHAIAPFKREEVVGRKFAVIQYCYKTANAAHFDWPGLWQQSIGVWSYYELPVPKGVPYYHAPLGVDSHVFRGNGGTRPIGIVTSGYVNGRGAEAIAPVADVAAETEFRVWHLGPDKVEGMEQRREGSWESHLHVTDTALCWAYAHAQFVSGLRWVEGFELPAAEGLLCGARPIFFDRPESRKWFSDYAEFVREATDDELKEDLRKLFRDGPRPVSEEEIEAARERFSWESIARGFWQRMGL